MKLYFIVLIFITILFYIIHAGPINVEYDITPITANSTISNSFLISTIIPITCPAPTTTTTINDDPDTPIRCTISQVHFQLPPSPQLEPTPDPTPEPPQPPIPDPGDDDDKHDEGDDDDKHDEGDQDDDNINPISPTFFPTFYNSPTIINTTTLTLIAMDIIIMGEELDSHMTNPIHTQFKDNIIDTTITIPTFQHQKNVYMSFLVSFDPSTSSFTQELKPINYNLTLTVTNDKLSSTYYFDINVPVVDHIGYLQSVAQFKHYSITGNIQDENENNLPDYDTLSTTTTTTITTTQGQTTTTTTTTGNDLLSFETNQFTPQARPIISIYDIIPILSFSNITIPLIGNPKSRWDFETITISTTGFLQFDLVNNNGNISRDQTITCTINNLEFAPTFSYDSGPSKNTIMSFQIPEYVSSLLQSTPGATLSFDCPYQLILKPSYPNLNVTSPHITNLPFALTLSMIGTKDQEPYTFSTSTLIQTTSIFIMSQPPDLTRPLTKLSIKDSYFDSDVLYCKLHILHEWSRAFGFQDLLETFVFNVIPQSTITVERRPVQSDHYRNATPNTQQYSLAPPKEQSDTRPPLPINTTWTTGAFPLNVDTINKKSKDHGIAVLISVPLKLEQEYQRGALAQCGFIYSQFYGQKTYSVSLTTNKIQKQLSSSSSSSTNNGLTDIPPPITSISILSTSSVRYVPPVATLMSFNVTDVNGPIQFDVYLKDFKTTVSTGMIVLEFPSQSYTFKGEFTCHFNDLKVRGSGIDARTGDQLTYFNLKFDFNDISRAFPPGSDVHISCPQSVLLPAWSNYYYVSATIPIRIMIYDDTTKTNLVASSSTLSDLPATRKYIVIVIMLSVIGFFFLLTVVLTKICNGLIDRLHRHKVHVIQYNNNENNSRTATSYGLGPAEALTSSTAFFTAFTQSNGGYGYEQLDDGKYSQPQQRIPHYDYEIPLHPGRK